MHSTNSIVFSGGERFRFGTLGLQIKTHQTVIWFSSLFFILIRQTSLFLYDLTVKMKNVNSF